MWDFKPKLEKANPKQIIVFLDNRWLPANIYYENTVYKCLVALMSLNTSFKYMCMTFVYKEYLVYAWIHTGRKIIPKQWNFFLTVSVVGDKLSKNYKLQTLCKKGDGGVKQCPTFGYFFNVLNIFVWLKEAQGNILCSLLTPYFIGYITF